MLIGQATALQTIFTSLSKRAVQQEHMVHYQTFLGLVFEAQSQSRATISALVDLKYSRHATFVKQANIAHGPQGAETSSRLIRWVMINSFCGEHWVPKPDERCALQRYVSFRCTLQLAH
ncbi:MAG TPA: hypothetical protein DCP03_17725 [Polaromonas sp.]|uniref:hypothetical protein n=1 Tax=Polaromonas sp. UBA4122 TaxID=1947074 RepID=UPI000ECEFDC1|nr:hypothetical protein [Polaromonas sp. UBA4122]HAL39836.1 hypothetical protein [Polaromonas sp.]